MWQPLRSRRLASITSKDRSVCRKGTLWRGPRKTAHAPHVWPSQACWGDWGHHHGRVEPCLPREIIDLLEVRRDNKIQEVGFNAEALRSRDQFHARVTGRGCGLRMMRAP